MFASNSTSTKRKASSVTKERDLLTPAAEWKIAGKKFANIHFKHYAPKTQPIGMKLHAFRISSIFHKVALCLLTMLIGIELTHNPSTRSFCRRIHPKTHVFDENVPKTHTKLGNYLQTVISSLFVFRLQNTQSQFT